MWVENRDDRILCSLCNFSEFDGDNSAVLTAATVEEWAEVAV